MTKWYILGSIFNGVDFYLNFTSCGFVYFQSIVLQTDQFFYHNYLEF